MAKPTPKEEDHETGPRYPYAWPLTAEQVEAAKEAFVNSVDPDAVCCLASRHYEQLYGARAPAHGPGTGLNGEFGNAKEEALAPRCRLFRQSRQGSFNVCFFVEFAADIQGGEEVAKPPVRWVVRIPMIPALHDAWTKVESEVATIRYLKKETTIPVADVYAYGCGEDLTRNDKDAVDPFQAVAASDTSERSGTDYTDSENGLLSDSSGSDTAPSEFDLDVSLPPAPPTTLQAVNAAKAAAHSCVYMILDYLPGKPLNIDAFYGDAVERQKHLYAQLIDILAQLRSLEFPAAGSLMPNPDGGPDSDPVLGDLLCVEWNELQRATYGQAARAIRPPATQHLCTSLEYALYQHALMSEAYKIPMSDESLATVRMQVFALYDLQCRLSDVVQAQGNDGERDVFVLAHADLRWSNILVDDSLNIQGVVDWEWSGTVPAQLFMPPPWLGSIYASRVAGYEYEEAYQIFHRVLLEAAAAEAETPEDGTPLATAKGKTKGKTGGRFRRLADEWDSNLPKSLDLPVAVILRNHYSLVETYYFSVFPKFFDDLPLDYVQGYFEDDAPSAHALLLRRDEFARKQITDQYTQYLKKQGLYVSRTPTGDDLAQTKKRDILYRQLLQEELAHYKRTLPSRRDDRTIRKLTETLLGWNIATRQRSS